jgi:hypothetical protein
MKELARLAVIKGAIDGAYTVKQAGRHPGKDNRLEKERRVPKSELHPFSGTAGGKRTDKNQLYQSVKDTGRGRYYVSQDTP